MGRVFATGARSGASASAITGAGSSGQIAYFTSAQVIAGATGVTTDGLTLTVASGAQSNIILSGGPGTSAGVIRFQNLAASGHYNWLIGAQFNTSETWEVTPSTAPDGTTFTSPLLSIYQAGRFRFNGSMLDINGNTGVFARIGAGASGILADTTIYGLYADPLMPSTNPTLSVAAITVSRVRTAAAAFTTSTAFAFFAENASKGAGSTITRLTNYYGDTQTAGTNNSFLTDNNSYTGNWFINSTATNPSFVAGNWRVGVSTVQTFTTETSTMLFTSDGDAGSHNVLNAFLDLNGNTPFTVAGNGLVSINATTKRTITSNTTDTAVRFAGIFSQLQFAVSGGVTYTNAQANGWSGYTIAPPAAFSGSLAITNYHGIYIQANSAVTGTYKIGIRIGAQTAATNNAAISDGVAFTGTWGFNFTSTTQNLIVGNLVNVTAALATNATDGFLYLPTCAGTPTGVPTAYTGANAHIYDTTNNKLWVYNGAWRGIVLV